MESILLALVVLALAAAVAAWRLGRLWRAQSGLPVRARVVYSDTGAWEQVAEPLFSRRYLLSGKPDYIVELERDRIPVEVKPNRVASEPRLSDALQLAAYGLLIEEDAGSRPPYGLLKYRNAVFRVEFTEELRAELLSVLNAMREDLAAESVARSHADPRRCRACGYREACGEALEE